MLMQNADADAKFDGFFFLMYDKSSPTANIFEARLQVHVC